MFLSSQNVKWLLLIAEWINLSSMALGSPWSGSSLLPSSALTALPSPPSPPLSLGSVLTTWCILFPQLCWVSPFFPHLQPGSEIKVQLEGYHCGRKAFPILDPTNIKTCFFLWLVCINIQWQLWVLTACSAMGLYFWPLSLYFNMSHKLAHIVLGPSS